MKTVKSELHKIISLRSTWIVSAIGVVVLLVRNFMQYSTVMNEKSGASSALSSSIPLFMVFFVMVIMLFVTNEYQNKVVTISLAINPRRKSYLMSKWLSCLVFVLGLWFINSLLSILIFYLVGNNESRHYLLGTFLLSTITLIIASSCYFFLAVLTKNSISSILIFLISIYVFSTLVQFPGMMSESLQPLSDVLVQLSPDSLIQRSISYYSAAGPGLNWWQSLFILFSYSLVLFFSGVRSFQKYDF